MKSNEYERLRAAIKDYLVQRDVEVKEAINAGHPIPKGLEWVADILTTPYT